MCGMLPLPMDRPAVPRLLTSPRLRSWLRAAAPWLGLLLLNALFVLPSVAWQLPRRPLLILSPSGDLLLGVALCAAATGVRHAAWIRRGVLLVLVLLWLYMWPALIGQIIIRQAPLLYDLLFLVKHVGVLVLDLWSWARFAALLGILAGLALATWLGHRLFRAVVDALAALPLRRSAPVAAGLLLVLAGISALHNKKRIVGVKAAGGLVWTTPALTSNLWRSYKMYRRIQRGLERSPYARYREDYALARKPDVHLFLVESYGRILFSHPDTETGWHERLQGYDQRLAAAGWHVVSGFSEAPVSGGGSWMAEATLLTGIRVRYEAVFRHLVDDIRRTPNLVRFLDAQGYQTVLLAPKDRARPGITLENRYDYDTTLFALDLEYEGPSIGWGIIPDQYSLGYAHEHVFRLADGPMFTNFHMVSSHAPWNVVPHVVDDWRVLGEPEDERRPENPEAYGGANLKELEDRLRHYKRFRAPRYAYMGEIDGFRLESFAAAVAYDLELLVRYLEDLQGDKIVIIMGDHQPPIVSDVDESFDVPVHVFSRDPALLEEFLEAEFTGGMDMNNGRGTTMSHEGMFSLFVRALVRCCGEPGAELPEVRPAGIRIGN